MTLYDDPTDPTQPKYAQADEPDQPSEQQDPPQPTGWKDRVRFSAESGGFAYRPNQLVVMGTESMIAPAVELLAEQGFDVRVERLGTTGWRLRGDFDVEMVAADLRDLGLRADPNYVLFTHSCGCGSCGGAFGANPFTANPFTANPFTANPFTANPFTANPFTANPFTANPFTANPFTANPFTANPFTANSRTTGVRTSSAIPAKPPQRTMPTLPPNNKNHTAIVVDTGITGPNDTPPFLSTSMIDLTQTADHDAADVEPADGYLDPASGHGTFIAGIIEQLSPGRVVRSAKVLSTLGDGDTWEISALLNELVDKKQVNEFTVLNLSFGGYADSNMPVLAAAIRRVQSAGGVVVASAGNDSRSEPTYPAALPNVVSVGSIEPGGRAPYSNFGCWVRACAPGSSVISSFFESFDGAVETTAPGAPGDLDHFEQWASWTGTSFAAPIVVAALLRHMAVTDCNAKTAVTELIDDPKLFRYPGLGTVINLVP